ncbi:MAG TPA: hypothetical protein VLY24_05190 [Bryobacteraceae bacterium]|nr:hypothetical protein [Bryobacteraceae bacterium]
MNCRRWLPMATLLALSHMLWGQWINYPTRGTPRTRDGKPDLSAPTLRTRDGKPDLSGIWNPDYSAIPRVPPGTIIISSQGPDYSLQFWRPNAAPIPMTPWAEAIFKERDRVYGLGRPAAHCLPHSIPDAMLVDNFKIIQNPGLTMILYEEFTRFRQIFTDGRTHPKEMNPAWLGYSIGKWDHDTFVVDTRGFNDRSWLDDAGHPHSELLHTIERYHRVNFGHMNVEVTIEDPKAYTEPWSVTLYFNLLPDTELIEDVCDNEKDTPHIIGSAVSDDKKIGVDLAVDILAQYQGSYELKVPRSDIENFDITLSGRRLVMSGAALTPLSPTEFTGSFGNVKFVKNADGKVTGMILGWSSGGEDEFVRRAVASPAGRK